MTEDEKNVVVTVVYKILFVQVLLKKKHKNTYFNKDLVQITQELKTENAIRSLIRLDNHHFVEILVVACEALKVHEWFMGSFVNHNSLLVFIYATICEVTIGRHLSNLLILQ